MPRFKFQIELLEGGEHIIAYDVEDGDCATHAKERCIENYGTTGIRVTLSGRVSGAQDEAAWVGQNDA